MTRVDFLNVTAATTSCLLLFQSHQGRFKDLSYVFGFLMYFLGPPEVFVSVRIWYMAGVHFGEQKSGNFQSNILGAVANCIL